MNASKTRRPTPTDWLRASCIAGGVLFLGGVAARVASAFIGGRFADRPIPRDLLFELVPHLTWTQYIADGLAMLMPLIVAWYVLRKAPEDAPGVVALMGVMQLCRAVINVLTPLASPLGNGTYWGFIPYVQNGMFTSGHVATALLCYLVVDRRRAPRLKPLMGWLVIAESVTLISSRGHYSIDVIGGILLAYVLYRAWNDETGLRWLRRLVTP